MGLNEVVAFVGRHLIDCTIVEELKDAIQEIRSRSPESVLADLDLGRCAITDIIRPEPCNLYL